MALDGATLVLLGPREVHIKWELHTSCLFHG